MSDRDRIKIAEAMGWEFFEGKISEQYFCNSAPDRGYPDIFNSSWIKRPGSKNWECYTCGCATPPDPFNDANDDYAVLEWMRTNHRIPYHLRSQFLVDYKIGNFARAALKAIEETS